ncbi:hypothetical protein T265_01561 [Opisthorchis viverrini]|uniref:Uncharacterized protein n=1 Tax=Opisthorchis viverrini TaxID=6198 RepID=A0A074ZY06_OPIVI|nr:hypothetical protein T265_01561 [Opisthorchis viverrini]KER32333.1 hypothetical protein T265_01561 [Opisthorchis viverrini]
MVCSELKKLNGYGTREGAKEEQNRTVALVAVEDAGFPCEHYIAGTTRSATSQDNETVRLIHCTKQSFLYILPTYTINAIQHDPRSEYKKMGQGMVQETLDRTVQSQLMRRFEVELNEPTKRTRAQASSLQYWPHGGLQKETRPIYVNRMQLTRLRRPRPEGDTILSATENA